MKKQFSLALASLLALSFSLPLAGCVDDKIAKLAPDYEGEYNITVSDAINGFSNLDYSFGESDGKGLIVARTNKNGSESYQLFDIVAQKFVPNTTSSNPIYKLDEGLFYSAVSNDTTTSYTLYHRNGAQEMGIGSVSNGIFTSAKDNLRTYVDVKGTLVTEDDPFIEIFNKAKSNNCAKVGKYYLSGGYYIDEDEFDDYQSIANIVIYTSAGKQERTINPTLRLGLSSNTSVNFFNAKWTIGNKMFFQVLTKLPSMEDSYNFYIGDDKYDIATYCYNVKDDKISKMKDFHYVVTDVYSSNENNVILQVCEIKNKQIINQPFLQGFNSKCKVSIDIQGLVPGATDYSYDPISNFSTLKTTEYTHIYNGSKHLRTLDSDYKVIGECIVNYAYDVATDAQSLTLYKIEDASNPKAISLVTDYSATYNNNILYRTTTNQIHLFDTKTSEDLEMTTISEKQEMVISTPYYFGVYDTEEMKTTYYFMDTNAPNLELNGYYDISNTPSYTLNGTRYQIIKTQKDGVYSYKILAISSPYVEA